MTARLGGVSLTDSYLSYDMLVVALVAAGFAVQSALRPRGAKAAWKIRTGADWRDVPERYGPLAAPLGTRPPRR